MFIFCSFVKHRYMKNFVNEYKSKKSCLFVNLFLAIIICFCGGVMFTGCCRNAIGYHVKAMPSKIVYQVNETPSFDGLKIEAINNDGTFSRFRFDGRHISNVDTSTPGVKKVVVEKDNMSLSFNIYVANTVVNDSDNLKQILSSANNGDIIYLRSGSYAAQTSTDERFKDIVINKSLTIIGDGSNSTIFSGNFIVGANYNGGVYTKISGFENVTFNGIGFKLNYTVKNNFIEYSDLYGKTDRNGAIRCFDTKNLNITNCSFRGYGYGIYGDSPDGLTVNNCTFKSIQKNAIYISNDITNSTIYKNIFVDIANNVVSFDNNEQSNLGAILLNFSNEGPKGIIICKNIFTRIALRDGDVVYYDDNSKVQAQATSSNLFSMSYANNSSVIFLVSSAQNDLQVTGIVLSSNNYGQTLQNLSMGAKGKNTINQNGIIVVD